MNEIFTNTTAPYVPTEATFNECAERLSNNDAKKQGFFAETQDRRLSFDEKHFEKFLREDDQGVGAKRKRQNPLGDFKFKRINEYF